MGTTIKYGVEAEHPTYTKGVIFHGGKAVGYAILTDKEWPFTNALERLKLPQGWIYLTYIEIFPNFRGYGIGSEAVGVLTGDLKKKGYKHLVLAPRIELAGWWESMGFVPISKDGFMIKRL